MNKYTFKDYQLSAETIALKLGTGWDVAIILGTGLDALESMVEYEDMLSYDQIPGFCCSTAPGHRGALLSGKVGNKKVLIMSGRLHSYEGYTPEEIVFPVRVMKLLGIEKLIITNGCGGLNTAWNEGDYMVIKDHLSFFMQSPCAGANIDEFGERFFDISTVYSKELRQLAHSAAQVLGMTLREGVYAYMPGPQFESPSEVKALQMLGGDAVGMSTVQEAVAAAHCSMQVLGISHIANFAVSLSDGPVECGVIHTDKTPIIRLLKQIIQDL